MMLLRHSPPRWPALVALTFVSLVRQVPALTVQYCSGQNTGLGDPTFWKYQSNGWCHDYCVDNYAFAVLQDANCWCSNYVPGVTTSSDSCNTPCPGYDTDNCGGNGLFAYIALGRSPSGTVGASSDTTVVPTTDPSQTALTTTSTGYTHTITWVPTPVKSVETETGQVRTVTITPTSPATASQDVSSIAQLEPSTGLSAGQAVGLTIGLVAAVAIIGAVIFFFIRKRRKDVSNDQLGEVMGGDGSSGPSPHRAMSQNSRYMLGTDGKQVVEGWEPEIEPPGNRRSRLMPVDPRLDPFASVYKRGSGSISRESITTVRDDHDYSRRIHSDGRILRATNPDD